MDQGGSLDETSRRKKKSDIHCDKHFAPSLDGILHKDLATHIVEHRNSGNVVTQAYNRIDARKG